MECALTESKWRGHVGAYRIFSANKEVTSLFDCDSPYGPTYTGQTALLKRIRRSLYYKVLKKDLLIRSIFEKSPWSQRLGAPKPGDAK